MGTLWLAELPGAAGTARRVAIKRLLPELARDAAFLERFIDEARLAMDLHHGHIVGTLELAEAEGEYFIVMEYVDGWDLRCVLRQVRQRGGTVPPAIGLHMIVDALRGLAYAHDRTDESGAPLHLVHRDISPANLLVSRDGSVRIADFGIASARSRAAVTRTGEVRGKIAYMAPEQAAGMPVDNRTDLFALGVVAWELARLERPFEGATDGESLARLQQGLRPNAREALPEDWRPAADMLERALATAPGDRWSSADDWLEALHPLQRDPAWSASPRQVARWLDALFAPVPGEPVGLDGMLAAELDRLAAAGSSRTPSAAHARTPSIVSVRRGVERAAQGPAPEPSPPHARAPSESPPRALPSPDPFPTQTLAHPAPPVAPAPGQADGAWWWRALPGVVLLVLLVVGGLLGRPTLVVQTEPTGALVLVDGVVRGPSPLRIAGWGWDRHLRVEATGMLPAEQVWASRWGTREAWSLTLEPAPRVVEFASVPPGAWVEVAGVGALTAGNSLQVPVHQPLRVRMTLEGHRPWEGEVRVLPGQGRVSVVLEPLPEDPSPGAPLSPVASETGEVREQASGDTVPAGVRDSALSPGSDARPRAAEEGRRWSLQGVPVEAEVRWRGQAWSTDRALVLPAGESAGVVEVTLEGHEPWTRSLGPDRASGVLTVQLVPAAAPGALVLVFREPPFVGEVEVDGRPLGRWDRRPLPVSAGSHRVRVRNEAHGTTFEAPVDIRAGEPTRLTVEWRR
jgi:serine/threonine protein kinase